MDNQEELRKQLLKYMEGGNAHKTLGEAVEDFPVKLMNSKPKRSPYTFWHLLEHIRISLHDNLLFIHDTNYKYMDWPKDYWPDKDQSADKETWDKTIASINEDMKALRKAVKDPKTDLLAHIPHGEGQTIFHEVMLVIDHAAYHTGEFILMRRVMGIWKE